MKPSSVVLFVLPSLRISGGIIETLRLAGELRSHGIDARIVALWKHPNSLQRIDIPDISDIPIVYLSELAPSRLRAIFDLFALMLRYRNFLREIQRQSGNRAPAVVVTHYSTLLFEWFTAPAMRYCFLQDEEWLFVTNSLLRRALRRFILFSCGHCQVIAANPYIAERISSAGVVPIAEAPIWAAPFYGECSQAQDRPIDLVMVLRHGRIKRLDLYMLLLAEFAGPNGLSCAVITCEDDIAVEVSKTTSLCLLRPSSGDMKALFQCSKIFVLLSEREGFGLPPLEAMGAGCVPLCRDSGGVRCYMKGALTDNLVPLDASLKVTLERLRILLADPEQLRKLSLEARRLFIAGAEQSRQKREIALQLLASQ